MKAVNKLLAIQVASTISILSLVALIVIISTNKYIESNFANDLFYEHILFEIELINSTNLNKKNLDNKPRMERIRNSMDHMPHSTKSPFNRDSAKNVISFAIPYDGINIIYFSNINFSLNTDDIKLFYNAPLNSISKITIDNVNYLTVTTKVDNLIATTLLPTNYVSSFMFPIFIVFAGLLLIIAFASSVTTFFAQRIITKPINILINTTKEIGNKNFDYKALINTNDEFSTLASSINKMSYNLKEKDLEQKKFYENLSHEIKTPITVISGYAQGIRSGIMDNDSLDIIVDECNKLKKQVEDIIYLSKLDTIKDNYNFKNIDINNIIGSSLGHLESIIILKDIDIIFEPSTTIFSHVDEEKFSKVIVNILSNCIKYTKNTITITSEYNNNDVIIKIFDNGNGFNNDILKNPFSGNIIGEKGGSGVGLTIIKKIIDSHNSHIFINNNDDGGAIYTIVLKQ